MVISTSAGVPICPVASKRLMVDSGTPDLKPRVLRVQPSASRAALARSPKPSVRSVGYLNAMDSMLPAIAFFIHQWTKY